MATVIKKRKNREAGAEPQEYEFWACDRDGRKAVGQLKDQSTGLVIDVCEECKTNLLKLKGFVLYGGGREWP